MTGTETLTSHKVLQLEQKLIDAGLIQLTVAPERTDSQSMARSVSAKELSKRIAEMHNNGSLAEKNVVAEPMVQALRLAVADISENGGQIAASLISALDNNANQKHYLALPHKAAGELQDYDYYVQQSATYRELANFTRTHHLGAGMAPSPAQHKGR